MTDKGQLADPKNDTTWKIIPVAFTAKPVKRRNLENVECLHYDCHINDAVAVHAKMSKQNLTAVWNYIV